MNIKHMHGEKLTRGQAILAKCSECMCDYVDGRVDCRVNKCPLYPFMPYRRPEQTLYELKRAKEVGE